MPILGNSPLEVRIEIGRNDRLAGQSIGGTQAQFKMSVLWSEHIGKQSPLATAQQR